MNKILILGVLATFLVVGCVVPIEETHEQPTEGELVQEILPQVFVEELITVSGNDEVSTVTIKAVKEGDRWYFPSDEYEDEFLNVGLHSDSFIKLDSSHIGFLEEGEAIWLTPMISNGNGVLFNAIYSREITYCDAESVSMMGKDYDLSKLMDGTPFEHDDKWKVALDHDGSCLKRLIVYLDGYFYDLKDGEQINLFKNDNTVLLKFNNINTEPKVKVIATKFVEREKQEEDQKEIRTSSEYVIDGTVVHPYVPSDQKSYAETEITDRSGMKISFQPGLPMFVEDFRWPQFENLKENDMSYLYIQGEVWGIIRLRGPKSAYEYDIGEWKSPDQREGIHIPKSELVIGRCSEFVINQCENISVNNTSYTMRIDIGQILLDDVNRTCQTWQRQSIYQLEGHTLDEIDNFKQINNKWVKLEEVMPVDAAWAALSICDDVINLTSGEVEIGWENHTSNYSYFDFLEREEREIEYNNPRLKSIFIPRSSPIFEKLSAQ